MTSNSLRLLTASLLLWVSCAAWGQVSVLTEARDLIHGGNAQAGLELLQKNPLPDSAEYHYFYGIALLDLGRPDQAVDEFSRALAIKPDLIQAKAELGRAQLLSGNYLAAHLAFDEVKAANPPPEVMSAIDSYTEKFHDVVQALRPRARASVLIGLGYDTNVNSATSAQRVLLPLFGGINATLSPDARAKRDGFKSVGAELSGFHPINESTEIFGGAAAYLKANDDVDTYDFLTGNANAGLRYSFGANQVNQVSLTYGYDAIQQDYNRVRDTQSVTAELRRIVHPLAELSVYAQWSELDYIQEDYRDAKRQIYGVAVNPVAFGKRLFNLPPILTIYGGEENPDQNDVDHLGNDILGLRTTALYIFSSRNTLVGGISYERRHYQGDDPVFLEARRDWQTDVNLAWVHGFNAHWRLTPSVSYTNSRSNIDVMAFERTAAQLTLRYDF